jgi:hypothetical protein
VASLIMRMCGASAKTAQTVLRSSTPGQTSEFRILALEVLAGGTAVALGGRLSDGGLERQQMGCGSSGR